MTDSKSLVKQAGELADNGQPDAAMEICNRVLLDEPDNVSAIYVAACVMLDAARHTQAIQMAKRCAELKPRDPRGWGLLSLCYGELSRYDESIQYAEKALALRRDCKTLADIAYAHTNAGNWEQADRLSLDAIKLATGDESALGKDAMRQALVSQAYIRLAYKDWQAGFEGFRRTMRTKWRKEREYTGPDGQVTKEWTGEADATLIVTGEQGLGDEIMAASMVPDACDAVKTFVLDCDARLAPLFKRSFPKAIIAPNRRDDAVRIPVMPTHHKTLFGLGEVLRKADWDFPREAYLKPREDYIAMFKALLDAPTIGIAYSGGLPRTGMEQRKAGLNAMLPLIRSHPECKFVSLEYKDDAEEVAAFHKNWGHKILRFPWVTQSPDMDLLAGLLAACDSVVGVHTSALHVAAACGVPTTFICHRGSGWRYAPDELLWYPPSTKLHRKRPGESWREAVGRL
jgi:hypothetical protein